MNKTSIEKKLKQYLNRQPTQGEIINAEKDYNIISQVLEDEVEDLKKRVNTLENG